MTDAAGKRSTPGRNDPCPCGSGIKFKRCCQPSRSTPADEYLAEYTVAVLPGTGEASGWVYWSATTKAAFTAAGLRDTVLQQSVLGGVADVIAEAQGSVPGARADLIDGETRWLSFEGRGHGGHGPVWYVHTGDAAPEAGPVTPPGAPPHSLLRGTPPPLR